MEDLTCQTCRKKATLAQQQPTKEGYPNNLVILDEKFFLNKGPSNAHAGHSIEGGSYSIRLDRDSYVWLFSGRRGAGKSVAMTFFIVFAVLLYNMRIISNYTMILDTPLPSDGKTYLQHVKSETIDFEKLLMQSDDYKHVLIVLDEAPDIISHLGVADLEEPFGECLCSADSSWLQFLTAGSPGRYLD